MKMQDWNAMAADLCGVAEAYEQGSIAEFEDRPELHEMFRTDATQMRQIAAAMIEGRFLKAVSIMGDMDTAARDIIPLEIFDALNTEVTGS